MSRTSPSWSTARHRYDESAKCSASSRLAPPSISQHARRRSQHLQPPTPSRLTLDAPDLPSRARKSMEQCGCRSVIAYSAWRSFCSTQLNLTMPQLGLRDKIEVPRYTRRRPLGVWSCLKFKEIPP